MISPYILSQINNLKSSALVIDLETSSHYSDGTPINLKTNFDDYVENAKVKWVFMYSYRYNKEYYYSAFDNPVEILSLIAEHGVLVSFNGEEFDVPILINNGFIEKKRKPLQADLYQILGTSTQKNRRGYSLKNRGEQMKLSFKNNSLRHIAEVMGVETQKGDIDYTIFHKNEWTEEERKEIIKYGTGDIMSTKEIFDKVWDFWLPFVEFLPENKVMDLTWIRSTVASMTYICACNVLGVEPTYNDTPSPKEDMGGNVLLPPYETLKDVWYLDYSSLYPHMMIMFGLFSEIFDEIQSCKKVWHKNILFEAKGNYDIARMNPLAKYVAEKLKERIDLQKNDPDNPMIYALKIFLNSLYGVARSSRFEQVGSKNCGWDTCWLGQQVQAFTIEMFDDFGFDAVYGDTDSVMLIARDSKNSNREYVQECLNTIIEIINDSVPFPVETFNIKIEHNLDYILWPWSFQEVIEEKVRKKINDGIMDGFHEEIINKKKAIIKDDTGEVVKYGRSWVKVRQGKKKNYLYIYNNGE